jgi:hypothetical protein
MLNLRSTRPLLEEKRWKKKLLYQDRPMLKVVVRFIAPNPVSDVLKMAINFLEKINVKVATTHDVNLSRKTT